MRVKRVRRQGKGIKDVVLPALRGAAHHAADRAIFNAKATTRTTIRAVGLGKLGGAVDATSSLRKRAQTTALGRGRAWGAIFARGGRYSRANQALMSYTQGAIIRPGAGKKWLAYATTGAGRTMRMPRAAGGFGNFRTTPGRAGKQLKFIQFSPKTAALVLFNASVSKKTGRAKAMGARLGRGAERRDFVVMFWLIRYTRRTARFSQARIVQREARKIGQYAAEYQQRAGNRR